MLVQLNKQLHKYAHLLNKDFATSLENADPPMKNNKFLRMYLEIFRIFWGLTCNAVLILPIFYASIINDSYQK